MSDRPETKKHLGRILLQRKVVTPDGLTELLRQQSLQGGRLASTAVELGKADSADVLGALSEQQGLPAIDLRRLVLPLANLRLLSVDVARRHAILPLLCEDDRLFLAMADPDDKRVIQEVELSTGKRVFPYVALHGTLREVIEQAYAAFDRGASEYVGPLAEGDAAGADKARPNLLPGRAEALVTSGDSLVGFEDELSRLPSNKIAGKRSIKEY